MEGNLMSNCFIARYGKIKSEKHLMVALKHNLRETIYPSRSIDPSKTDLNYNFGFAGSSQSKLKMCKRLISDAGIKLRKDAVLAVELMVSLSTWDTEFDDIFNDVFEWAQKYYGVPIISFDVHLDERFPHCHILLFPILDGRMNGSKLVGHKAKIAMMKKSIETSVTKFYGILSCENSDAISSNRTLAIEIIERLQNDPIKKSIVWTIVNQLINRNPKIFKSVLDREVDNFLN